MDCLDELLTAGHSRRHGVTAHIAVASSLLADPQRKRAWPRRTVTFGRGRRAAAEAGNPKSSVTRIHSGQFAQQWTGATEFARPTGGRFRSPTRLVPRAAARFCAACGLRASA